MATHEVESNLATQGQNCAVINPYALADLVSGQRIPWDKISDPHSALEQVLATPYEELFDPKYGGPLYIGHMLDKNLALVRARSPLLDYKSPTEANDAETSGLRDISQFATLADLAKVADLKSILDWPIFCGDISRYSRLQISLRLPETLRTLQLGQALSPEVIRAITFDPKLVFNVDFGWTPPGAHWASGGDFFKETAEFFDPVQGAVANCYYIAALSAVAWSKPFQIAQMTRATGAGQQSFVDMMRFYKPDSGGVLDKQIEVSETVPQTMGGNFIYARSSEASEIWPAVYEKAYAKLKTGTSSDHPDITATAWGDCVWATAQLTGGHRFYYGTASRSADTLWDLVRGNSMSYRTFNPMTAWTYSTGEAADRHLNYSSATVVASHCYTVLGWAYYNNRKYIVLRNPWGNTEATVGALNAMLWMYDISWWRPINLAPVDGTFAMEAWAFKTYFAGLGVAK